MRSAGVQVSGTEGTPALSRVLAEADLARTWVARTWPRQVVAAGTVRVLVAADAAQFARLRGAVPESSELAASTTASGDVVLAPAAVRELTAQGRRVVLAHEITHVVLGQAGRTGLPRWVVEGSAEYTAYRWAGLSLAAACVTLAEDMRTGNRPTGPPADGEFSGAHEQSAYQQAHAYMSFLVARFGLPAWQRFVLAADAGSAAAFGDSFSGATPATLAPAYVVFLRRTIG